MKDADEFYKPEIKQKVLVDGIAGETIAKGAKGKMLINKLQDLQEKGILTGVVYNAADRVRDWGNTALHELLEEPVDEEVTKKLLTLVDLVIRDVYITPAQIDTLEGENSA